MVQICKGWGREVGQLRKIAVEFAAALLARKARQRVRLVKCAWRLFEQLTQSGEMRAHRAGKWALQPFAQRVPIRVAVKDKIVHPLVALFEHGHDLVLEIGPTIVAPQKQRFDGRVQRRVVFPNLFERAASGSAIKLLRLIVDLQASAKAGENGLLQGELTAEGVDGRDAQLRGKVEEIPAEGTRTGSARCASDSMEKGLDASS